MGSSNCMDCGNGTRTYKDPRTPPLSVHLCLCKGCAVWAYDQAIEYDLDGVEELRKDRRNLGLLA